MDDFDTNPTMVDASVARVLVDEPVDGELLAIAYPTLSEEQLRTLRAYGEAEDFAPGTVLHAAGERGDELFLLDVGEVDVLTYSHERREGLAVLRHSPGSIIGELSALAGQPSFVTSRAVSDGVVHRIPHEAYRSLMDRENELSDVLLRAFAARRSLLRYGVVADSFHVVGTRHTRESLALRSWFARQRIPHKWFDVDEPSGALRAQSAGLRASDLPAVLSAADTIVTASPADVAARFDIRFRTDTARDVDLVVIGAGPAGMAAAVYGASEGLQTVVLDAVDVGGQAASSARIENYPGFSSGISGGDLLATFGLQAEKFGAELLAASPVKELTSDSQSLRTLLVDGREFTCRAVILATGVSYRSLDIPGWADLEHTSVYYAATEMEARSCVPDPVVVIGGANSAGQAALYLNSQGSDVTMVVRRDLDAAMSSYLVQRLRATPGIRIMEGSNVIAMHGESRMESVSVRTVTGDVERFPARGVFCFIGAEPATSWIPEVSRDDDGFILTDTDIGTDDDDVEAVWRAMGRDRLPFETSVPGVFAAGDVRHGSMKRVAAAVGEGASAVHSVHRAIAPRV